MLGTSSAPQGASQAHAVALSARVGSIADNHLGGWHSYRAAKSALNQYVRTAAIELGRTRKDAIVAALQERDAIDNLKRQGLDATGGTPEVFAAHIRSELAKWAKVVKDAGIKAD